MNDKAFMVMPFGNLLAQEAYAKIVKPVINVLGLEIERSDERFKNKPIVEDIVIAIKEAAIVIVDVSDKNPNCYYELGIAHSFLPQRNTFILSQGSSDDIPFDVRHYFVSCYDNTPKLRLECQRRLFEGIKTVLFEPNFYNDEFEQLIRNFEACGQMSAFYIALAILKSQRPIRYNEPITIEGYYKDLKSLQSSNFFFCHIGVDPLIKLNFIRKNEDFLELTERGKLLVNYLVSKGFVLLNSYAQIVVNGLKS